MNRREFIATAALAAGAVWAMPAGATMAATPAAGEPFRMARIRGHFRWADHPTGDQYLLKTFREQTGVHTDCTWYVVGLTDLKEMVKYPVLFLTSPEPFAYSPEEQRNLKEYLLRGGFLFADDCVYKGNGPRDLFFTSVKNMIDGMFEAKMTEIPLTDDLFHCFYDVPKVPVMQGKDDGAWGLYLKGRLAVFLDSGDIHCGWQSRYMREHGIGHWFAVDEETQSLHLGVNVLVYMMSH